MKRLQATSSEYKVPKQRDRPNEFEVQAYLYSALKVLGHDIRGEVNWADKKTFEHCRFDLVIYEGGVAKEILEIKWGQVNHKNGVENTRQGHRYRKFGIPVTFIYGMEDANNFLVAYHLLDARYR